MPVLRAGEPVDDFVQGSVAAARDHKVPTFVRGALCDLRRIARPTRLDEFCFDPAASNTPCRFYRLVSP